jgi:hypothetical protein
LVGEGFPHDSYCLLARLGPSEGQDEDLLRESMEALERLECQFWACAGPTLTPEAMRTCFRCSLLARLREHFGLTVCHVEETPVWTEAQRILSVARAGGREMTVEEAMAFASEPL